MFKTCSLLYYTVQIREINTKMHILPLLTLIWDEEYFQGWTVCTSLMLTISFRWALRQHLCTVTFLMPGVFSDKSLLSPWKRLMKRQCNEETGTGGCLWNVFRNWGNLPIFTFMAQTINYQLAVMLAGNQSQPILQFLNLICVHIN